MIIIIKENDQIQFAKKGKNPEDYLLGIGPKGSRASKISIASSTLSFVTSFFLISIASHTSMPFREGGRGTAMVLKVGVLPLEPGAGNRPCLGGKAGTISPTSSKRSSPAALKNRNEHVNINLIRSFLFLLSSTIDLPGVAVF